MQGKQIYQRDLKAIGNKYLLVIRRLGKRRFVLEIQYKFVPPGLAVYRFVIYQSLRECETLIAKALIKAEVIKHEG